MLPPKEETDFDPTVLSVREREVVDLAVLGHTDEQISQALTITTSTVNSYWVRIRGKVGQLSRTEIVAKMLHAGYHEEHVRQEAEVARLSALLTRANTELAGAKSQVAAAKGVDWHLLALHFASEALLVVEGGTKVVYANLQAEKLFCSEPGELVGRRLADLTDAGGRAQREALIAQFMAGAVAPPRLVLGVERACYVEVPEGEATRVTMVLERFQAHSRRMAIVTVRDFLGDVDEIVRSLRKPLAVL